MRYIARMTEATTPLHRSFVALATTPFVPGGPVPSPCVGVCRMSSASGLCEGCWRTRDELAAWGKSSDAVKRAIWQRIEQRQESAGLAR